MFFFFTCLHINSKTVGFFFYHTRTWTIQRDLFMVLFGRRLPRGDKSMATETKGHAPFYDEPLVLAFFDTLFLGNSFNDQLKPLFEGKRPDHLRKGVKNMVAISRGNLFVLRLKLAIISESGRSAPGRVARVHMITL